MVVPEPLVAAEALAEAEAAKTALVAAIVRDEGGEPDAKPDAACQPKWSNGEKRLMLAEPLAELLTYVVLKTRATTDGCRGFA
ncbi:MAG TPA: hypothetical protein VFI31_00865, partial [Pirellulales bacterium]|nr:hypothetical protein [Pirellulales bacterium]